MGFETVEVEGVPNIPMATLSYLRYKRKGKSKAGALPRLRIWIPTTISGFSKKTWFELQVGLGTDFGKARISAVTKETKNATKLVDQRHCSCFRFGHIPSLGDEIFDGEKVPVRKISEDIFEFDLPDFWVQAIREGIKRKAGVEK